MADMKYKEEVQEDPKVDSYTGGVSPGEGQEEVDPKKVKQVDSYISVLMELLHSPKSRDSVTDVLMSNPDPYMTVPQTAMKTNDMGVNLMKQSGVTVPFGTQLAASSALLTDIIHLGYAAAGWDQLTEEDIAAIYEDTIQMVIERGLKDGSIDPIQLQLDAEGMMNEDQKRAGDTLAKKGGLSAKPSDASMASQMSHRSAQKEKQKNMKQQSVDKKKDMQGALAGPQQGQPQAPQQGQGRVA